MALFLCRAAGRRKAMGLAGRCSAIIIVIGGFVERMLARHSLGGPESLFRRRRGGNAENASQAFARKRSRDRQQ